MLITPQTMVKNDWVTCESSIEENQLQQVGLDIRVKTILKITGTAVLSRDSKELPGYIDVPFNNEEYWSLTPGAYAFEAMEKCVIPVGYEGKVIHRSTFNRSGCFVTGSVYDPGYSGIIAGTMYVHIPILVQYGTRLAQFQMQTAESGEMYDGDYQDQESHSKAAENLNG